MAEKLYGSRDAPPPARRADARAEASFLAMVRVLRAIRSGAPAGRAERVPAATVAPACRPWAF